MTVAQVDSTLGRPKAVPFKTREFRVVYPLKADYYIIYATTEDTLAIEDRLSW